MSIDQAKNQKRSLEELKTVYPNIPEMDFTRLEKIYGEATVQELNSQLQGLTDIQKERWLKNKYAFSLEYAMGLLNATKETKP